MIAFRAIAAGSFTLAILLGVGPATAHDPTDSEDHASSSQSERRSAHVRDQWNAAREDRWDRAEAAREDRTNARETARNDRRQSRSQRIAQLREVLSGVTFGVTRGDDGESIWFSFPPSSGMDEGMGEQAQTRRGENAVRFHLGEALRNKPLARSSVSISGEVVRTKEVELRGSDVKHLVAMIKVGQDRKIVDLGDTKTLQGLNVNKGETIHVSGHIVDVGDMRVLRADRVEHNGKVAEHRYVPRDRDAFPSDQGPRTVRRPGRIEF